MIERGEPVTDKPTSHLSPAQHARIEALTASRKVQLRSDGFAKNGGPDTLDLVAVARFILDGNDPWPTEGEQ